jgi:hypothetical protein
MLGTKIGRERDDDWRLLARKKFVRDLSAQPLTDSAMLR